MDNTAIKQCAGCGGWKPLSAFHRFRGGWHPRCKACRRANRYRSDPDPEVRAVVVEFEGLDNAVAALLGRSWPRRIAQTRKEQVA